MSSTTLRHQQEVVVEDPSPRTTTAEAEVVGSNKRTSLALPIGLFANQSRPTTTTATATTSRAILATTIATTASSAASEPFTTTSTAAAGTATTVVVDRINSNNSNNGTETRRNSSSTTTKTKQVKISLGLSSSVLSPRKIQNKLRRSFSKNNNKSSTTTTMMPPPPPLLLLDEEEATTQAAACVRQPTNVVQWLEICCPNDVVPKVLAFCGPHTTATLMGTNRYWFRLIAKTDSTWRSLCEGMYKWTEGQDEVPTSWKDYYRTHPCVPVDYPSIPRALMVATDQSSSSSTTKNSSFMGRSSSSSSSDKKKNKQDQQQVHSIDIMLRPGKHIVKESLVVQTTLEDVKITVSTCKMPTNRHYSPRFAYAEQEHPQSFPTPRNNKNGKSGGKNHRNSSSTKLKQWMGCKSGATAAVVAPDSMDPPNLLAAAANFNNGGGDNMEDTSENSLYHQRSRARSLSAADASRIHAAAVSSSSLMPPPRYPTRATVVLRTRRNNEPVIRVKQGQLLLRGVDLQHASQGVDIWNGNAAIQVQPPLGPDNEPLVPSEANIPKPIATIENVAITSKSGRGVVCLDGGYVNLNDCMIYDCAATGLYIGGPGTEAEMTKTDVVRNGIGSRLPPNPRLPRVTSGHSGVYLEQGLAKISECNISSNYLTGISAVSFEKAFLHLSKTDLVANGQGNLEVPPPGTLSYDKSEIANDNNLASVGRPCLRSNLELPARARARASF